MKPDGSSADTIERAEIMNAVITVMRMRVFMMKMSRA